MRRTRRENGAGRSSPVTSLIGRPPIQMPKPSAGPADQSKPVNGGCPDNGRGRERRSTASSVVNSMNAKKRTLLITLTGRDRPGVTSRLFGTLTAFPVHVSDVEQVVIRGRLVLGVLLSYDSSHEIGALWASVEQVAADLEMDAEMSTGGSKKPKRKRGQLHVTVLGAPLKPAAMAAISGRIAAHGANIDRIERLASYPVT